MAIVFLLAVVALVAMPTLAVAAPVASATLPSAPQNASDRLPSYASSDIPEPYRLRVGGTVYGEASESRRIVVMTAPSPGPRPSDFPFGANVPIWTDPSAQSRPSMAVDGTGRIYVAFDQAAGAGQHDVYVTWSDDDGLSWMTPIAIADTAAYEGNASLVITTGDRAWVFYDSDETTTYNKAFFYVDSSDRGTTWTAHSVDFSPDAPFRTLRSASFAPTGAGVVGMYQIRCTDPATCGGGSSSILTLRNRDMVADHWEGVYFAQSPDIELFRPASAGSPSSPDMLYMAIVIETIDNAAYDVTWGMLDFFSNMFTQYGFSCNPFCASEEMPHPSIAVDGARGVVGAEFLDTTFLGPNRVILANYTSNLPSLGRWSQVHDASGREHVIDGGGADQSQIHFAIQGTQVSAGYWKAGAIWHASSADGGENWGQPTRVSDNTPATAVDGPRAIAVARFAGDPLLAWQDNRAMNPDIYFSRFQLPKATLTLDTIPTGLLVGFDGGSLVTAPASGNFTTQTWHMIMAANPQPGGAGTRYVFLRWNDSNTQNPRAIFLTADVTYTAIFGTQYYTVIASSPVPLNVTLDGTTQVAPIAFWCDASSTHTVSAPDHQPVNSTTAYRFDYWSDGYPLTHAITCNAQTVLTAVFVRMFLVTVTTIPEGLNISVDGTTYPAPSSFWWDEGSMHDLLAPSPQDTGPHTRWVFYRWADGPTTPARTITVTGATTYTAVYQYQYKVSFDTSPTGLALIVDGETVVTPFPAYYDEGRSIVVSAPEPQPGGVGTQYAFSRWDDGNPSPANTIIVDGDKTVTAFYVRQFYLNVTADVGTVTTLSGWYNEGDAVTLNAVPPPGSETDRYTFGGWTGDYIGPSPTESITMDSPKTIQANWIHEFRIIVESNAPGLPVDVDTDGLRTPGVVWWAEGSTHTLRAPTSLAQGLDTRWTFASWSGGVVQRQLTIVNVPGPTTYTASYSCEFRLVLTTNPAGLGVLVDGAPYVVPLWFEEGSQHTLEAASPQPAGTGTRYVFRSWDGGSAAAVRTLVIASPMAVTATYDAQYRIAVDSPHGNPICQGAVDGCWYLAGGQATIAVTSPFTDADGTQYALVAWSGDASGTSPSITLTVDGPKSVAASWEVVAVPMTPAPSVELLIMLAGAAIVITGATAFLLFRRKKRTAAPRSKDETKNPPS